MFSWKIYFTKKGRIRIIACLRALVILDGIQLRPLSPPASACPHCLFAPANVLEASHFVRLAEHGCDKHRIASESRSVVVTFRKSSHGRLNFQPSLNLRCESSPVFPPFSLSLCTDMVLCAWDVAGNSRRVVVPQDIHSE
jgi:hypothetical protein